MKKCSPYVRPAAAVISMALFAWLVRRTGMDTVLQTIHRLGWSILVLILLSGVRHLLRAQAWSWCVPANGVRPRALQLLGPRLMGEALNDLTPAGPLLGEPAKIVAVSKWILPRDAASSVVIENLVYILGALLFMLGGIVLALIKLAALRRLLWLGAALFLFALLSAAAVLWALHRRKPFLGSILDCLDRRGLRCSLLDRHSQSLRLIEATVYNFFRDRKGTLLAVLAAELATNFTGVAEAYMILALAAAHSSVLAAYLVESGSRAMQLAFSFIPLGLGVQEGAAAAILQALGYAASEGVSLAVIRKIRSLFWAGAGLCFMTHSMGLPAEETSGSQATPRPHLTPAAAISYPKEARAARREQIRRLAS
jgi:Lysylphosphatidylglycerol synthase TM region